jgi:hypothetical protein
MKNEKWISIENDLPDEYPYDVLVFGKSECGECFYDVAFYDGAWHCGYWDDEIDNITHWMPLPEPPEEEEGE